MTMEQPAPQVDRFEASKDRVGIDQFDLGVLLVHGIGEQQRGDTLTEAGDQIFRWLQLRVETPSDRKGDVTVLEVVARPPSGDAISAAHAVVRIAPPEGVERAKHWIVAEAWWAEVFRPATFNEMVGWCITVGPWVFATQVTGIARRLEIGVDVKPLLLRLVLIPVTLVFGFAMILGATILGFLVTVLAVAVVLLAVIHIPFLSDAAKRFQRQLANGFGDSYVLTRSPVRFGAMASSVRSDLQALREHCKSVVVIAHSQGTAVAWFALLQELTDGRVVGEGEPRRAPIGLFLTYGQAVRKLTFALEMARREQRGEQTSRQTVLVLAGPVFVGAAIAAYLLTDHWLLPLISGGLAVAVQLYLLSLAARIWQTSGEEMAEHWGRVLKQAPDIEWLDLWASADPASVGALGVDKPRIDSYKIRNLGSVLGDHTVYWHNTTEFLAIVGGKLFGLGGPAAYAVPLDDPHLVIAAMRRHARVVALSTMRFIVLGAVIAGLIWSLLTSFGERLIGFIDDLDLPFVDSFLADLPQWAELLAGFIPVLVAGFLFWGLVQWSWNRLTTADEATYFHSLERPLWSALWRVLGAVFGLVAGGVAVLLNAAYGPDLAAGYLIGTLLLALLGLSVLSGGGLTFAGTEASESTEAAIARIPIHPRLGKAVTGIPAALLILVPIGAAVAVSAQLAAVVLAVEALAISVVLAREGIREYGVFREKFDERSKDLAKAEETAAL